MEAACKAKLINLNGVNLKELFNEDSSTCTSSNEKPKISELTKIIDAESPAIETSMSNQDPKDNAHFVELYHSYALKDSMSDNENTSSSTSGLTNKLNTKAAVLKLPTESKEDKHDIDASNLVTNQDTLLHTSESGFAEDDDVEDIDDDYFEDDDDDELSKIRKKYNVQEDDGDDFEEDCGF